MASRHRSRSTSKVGNPSHTALAASAHEEHGNVEAVAHGLGFERVVFFSDAVFAIAITLLAIEIHVGEIADVLIDAELPRQLWGLWPQVLGYVIGFSVIGAFWLSHHTIFSYIKRYDRNLIWLNLLFLATIAISPFPTSVIGEYGSHQPAQIFYALCVGVAGLAKELLWWYASYHHRLLDPALDAKTIRQVTVRGLVVPLAFLLSIPVTWLGSVPTIVIWILIPFVSSALIRRAE